jgi:hypothetical protein
VKIDKLYFLLLNVLILDFVVVEAHHGPMFILHRVLLFFVNLFVLFCLKMSSSD